MNIQTTTIRPGRMVVVRTGVVGNVKYSKTVIEPETDTGDGGQKAKWETERVVKNADEQKEATQIRSKMRTIITNLCAQTSFGLLCPEDKAEALDTAVKEAHALKDEFNGKAMTTTINLYVIAGKVAADDVEAVRAINSEVRGLLETMERGIQSLDPKMVRDAADRARSLGSMLSPEMGERVKDAIATARAAATQIRKSAEQGAAEIDLASIKKITEARTAFLDLDEAVEVAAPVHEGRALDLAPLEIDDESIAPSAPTVQVPQFEME